MAQVMEIVFVCDFCGEEERVRDPEDSTMLEFEVKQTRPKTPKSKDRLLVHYHENHVPEGFAAYAGTKRDTAEAKV